MKASRILGLAMALAAWVVPVGVVAAGKPPPPPPPAVPGGLVHFTRQGLAWTMNTDGSGKTALPAVVLQDVGFDRVEPSRALHGGHRWFLTIRDIAGETYPNGATRRELFAVRDDGTVVTQLTSQPLVLPAQARWSPGDSTISWVGWSYAGGVLGPRGIYMASVLYDGSGDVAGLASQPATGAFESLNPGSHDWSPEGTRLVLLSGAPAGSLWIATLGTGATTPLATSVQATDPVWSPDGSRIAFSCFMTIKARNHTAIRTITPSGSGETTVVAESTQYDSFLRVMYPAWSPNGTHLVYERDSLAYFASGNRRDIYRVSVDGGTATNLTSDLDTSSPNAATPWGWR